MNDLTACKASTKFSIRTTRAINVAVLAAFKTNSGRYFDFDRLASHSDLLAVITFVIFVYWVCCNHMSSNCFARTNVCFCNNNLK